MVSGATETAAVLYVGEHEARVRSAVEMLPDEVGPVSVTVVAETAAALERIESGSVDCLICGEDRDGDAPTAFLRDAATADRSVPALFVTSDASLASDAVEAGAADVYVTEADRTDAPILARRIQNALLGGPRGTAEDTAESTSRSEYQGRLLDILDDIFYLLGPAGELERWNETLRTVTGYSDDEIASMEAIDFFAEEGKDRIADAIEETVENGSTSVEADLVTRAGERIPYEFSARRLEDADGAIRGVVGIGRDLTQRKAIEADRREKANLLDHIFNQVPTALYVKDDEARHVQMSDYDKDPEGMIGRTDPEIYGDTEFAIATYEDDMRVIEEGERIVNKEEYNPENDEWTLTSKVPWRNEDGEIRGLIGVSRLVTEKKEYERQLRRRKRAMEEAPVGISLLEAPDSPASMTYVNGKFQELTGYDRAESDGEPLSLLVGPDTDSERYAAIERAIDDGDHASDRMVLHRSDGTPFWGRLGVAPVTDESDELTHYVCFLQDVTDTKEHAEEIERRLDEFGEVLTEELRLPLRSAVDRLQSVAQSETTENVEAARETLERLDDLIDDLATVHSFSVKSRDVFEADPQTNDEEFLE